MKARKPQASPSGFHALRFVNIEELKILSSNKTVAASFKWQFSLTSGIMRENIDADQQRGNRVADHRLCFRYTGNRLPLIPTSDI